CGIVDGIFIGPHFFEGTVNAGRYSDFLQNRLPMLLQEVPLATRESMWSQQDGALAHSAWVVK
ncbi:hypothetical protein EAI_14062, partial [Harpegnathos saltator]